MKESKQGSRMKRVLVGLLCWHIGMFALSEEEHVLTNNQLFSGKHILITGGTGYLGRVLAEEILAHDPASIKIFSRDEVKAFNTQRFFKNNPKVISILGDVRNYESMVRHTRGVDLVIHTAALKRMDMMEHNVEESIRTNLLGSLNVFNACVANHVARVIFISTDKACLPINTYGACKFISEKIFTNYDRKAIDTIFTVVRFGNILESTGSVIPIFVDKIKKGENITLTDARMTRFIVTKNEAVNFIFDAIRYGVGGEIFVKRLPAFNIVDLINALKQKYKVDSQVDVIGLRPGEKIHEVLINKLEYRRTYIFNGMSIITPSLSEWLETLIEKKVVPLYIRRGERVDSSCEMSYSSKSAVLSYQELLDLLYKLDV